MVDDPKDTFRKSLGYHLLHAARLYRTMATKRLTELGLHQGQEQILILLMEQGAMSLGDLAASLQVRPPTMTKSIARLEAQGFVKRKDSKNDARSTTVSLTAQGKDRAAYVPAIMAKVDDELFGELDDKDRRRLRKGLRRIIKQELDTTDMED